MIFDKIELKDPEYGTVKKSSKIRKIKFKSLSFKNISNLWKNFRISCLDKRLEKAKDKLVSMEIENQDFNEKTLKGDMSVAESKLLKKSTVVARLESKIAFLKTGTEVTDDFISSRAIKLKDNMMRNLRYNSGTIYSVPEDKYEEIFSEPTKTETVDPEIEEIQRKTAESVQRIMDEMAAKKKAEAEEPRADTITAPSREEIRKTVDKMFETESKVPERVVSETEIQEAVEDAFKDIDVVPVVSAEEVKEAVEEEFDTKKVSKNESSTAKVNKYINEDGTYRMRREEIDEEIRITRFKRNENSPKTLVGVLKQELEKAGMPYVLSPETSNSDDKKVESKAETRVMPIVAPERGQLTVKQQVEDLSAAVDEVETMDDIKSIMDSVAALKVKQEAARSKAQAVAQANVELQAEKDAAIQELLSYRAALSQEFKATESQISAQQAENDAMASEIQSIRSVLGRTK